MEREVRRLEGMGQLGFGFGGSARPKERRAVEEELFLDADPHELFVGAQRLEVYLSESGMGWVLRLAALLRDLDYSAFARAYQPSGPRATSARHGRAGGSMRLSTGNGHCADWKAWRGMTLERGWVCGGHQPDHSTIGKFIQLHAARSSAKNSSSSW